MNGGNVYATACQTNIRTTIRTLSRTNTHTHTHTVCTTIHTYLLIPIGSVVPINVSVYLFYVFVPSLFVGNKPKKLDYSPAPEVKEFRGTTPSPYFNSSLSVIYNTFM